MKLSYVLAVLLVVLSIVSQIESAKLRSMSKSNCFDVVCSGATNKCCKKLKPSGQGYNGNCVRKTEDCPSGWEKAK